MSEIPSKSKERPIFGLLEEISGNRNNILRLDDIWGLLLQYTVRYDPRDIEHLISGMDKTLVLPMLEERIDSFPIPNSQEVLKDEMQWFIQRVQGGEAEQFDELDLHHTQVNGRITELILALPLSKAVKAALEELEDFEIPIAARLTHRATDKLDNLLPD